MTDNGGGADPHYVDDPHGEHGRGLPILVQLSRSWGFDHLDDGRLRVWFEVVHTAVPNGRTAVRADTPRKAAPTPPRPDDGAHEEPPASSAATAHPADR